MDGGASFVAIDQWDDPPAPAPVPVDPFMGLFAQGLPEPPGSALFAAALLAVLALRTLSRLRERGGGLLRARARPHSP